MNVMLSRRSKRLSLEDFEEMFFERPEDEKWELIDGRLVRGMVGARWEHHNIISNIDLAISTHLRSTNRPCRVFRESFFLKERKNDLAALPDIMVHCGRLAPDQAYVDDPLILLEVVSPGSEKKDRFLKRVAYLRLPSLLQYVVVDRDQPLIEVFSRDGDTWDAGTVLEGPGGTLHLPAIGFELPVAEIYRGVLSEGQ